MVKTASPAFPRFDTIPECDGRTDRHNGNAAVAYTVKPRYLATLGPGHNFGERRGWRLNGGSARMRSGTQECVYACTMCCWFIGLLLADTLPLKVMHQCVSVSCINHCTG